MNVLDRARRITVPEFLVWAEAQPSGRFELHDGRLVQMSPEQARHVKTKVAITNALAAAIQRTGLNCHALGDGMTVKINENTGYVPDALVYCGDEIDDEAQIVREPLIIVEVLSPTTAAKDRGDKLRDYFLLPSVQHYLIVDPERHFITHHQRHRNDFIQSGDVTLDPPGLAFQVAEAFAAP